jgi:hypothetical protein
MNDPWVEFERGRDKDHEHVCARIYLGLGIVLELWSEEVAAERRWEIEELTLDPADSGPPVYLDTRGSGKLMIRDSELVAFVRREWTLEVEREAKRDAMLRGQVVLDVRA